MSETNACAGDCSFGLASRLNASAKLCAVTGAAIPLEELKYWSVDLQEAYASPEAVLQRHFPEQARRLMQEKAR